MCSGGFNKLINPVGIIAPEGTLGDIIDPARAVNRKLFNADTPFQALIGDFHDKGESPQQAAPPTKPKKKSLTKQQRSLLTDPAQSANSRESTFLGKGQLK